MTAGHHTKSAPGRLLSLGLALAVAGGFVLSGCAQLGEKAQKAATGTGQAALAPALAPVLDLLRQGQSQVAAGNLGAAVTTMGGFEGLWAKAAPVIQPLAGDRWPAIETAATKLQETFASAEPSADQAQGAIGSLLGPLSALVGQ
ncbi:MAG: hypothetical protein AAFX65_03425 [Cyanobacteria bacterium J06638_7]